MENLTKEELISQIRVLRAHNTQLQNIITRNLKQGTTVEKPGKKFNFERCKFRHVLLKFFYLGWDSQGYVTQEDTVNTIEHHLFEALTKTCLIEKRETSNYHRCGRTDKGVSSFSQVISINLRSISDHINEELNYCKILNRVLPDNIQFLAWSRVPDGFSARFDCRTRLYKYFFPLGSLSVEDMGAAAQHLVGNHDFRNFCKMDVNNGVVEFRRSIISIDIAPVQNEEPNEFKMYVITIRGNAFLWHQIRCIVGVLLLIGQKKESPELILDLLDIDKNPRKPDYQMASEVPLNLYECEYEDITWTYDQESVNIATKKLRQFWTFSEIKSAMVRSMLDDIDKTAELQSGCLSENLIPGVKPRTYVPVMKRKLCESLEQKVAHAKKKGKTFKVNT